MKPASLRKFSKSYSTPPLEPERPDNKQKLAVDHSTDPLQFFSILCFSILRKPIFLSIRGKIGFYLCLCAGLSIITDLVKIPPSYFSSKSNLLNTVFAKWGWAWTMFPLCFYVIVSSLIYTGSDKNIMRGHLMRVGFGSICWYFCTGFFRFIENLTGQCVSLSANATIVAETKRLHTNRRACSNHGGNWMGFDISGHCFLMIMCNLWIMEELRVLQYWTRFGELIYPNGRLDNEDEENPPPQLAYLKPKTLKTIRSAYNRLSNLARISFNFLACLSMLWDFILLTTVIYFHTMPTKLLGCLFACTCWFLGYRVFFPLAKSGAALGFAPGMPGDGPIIFMPRFSN